MSKHPDPLANVERPQGFVRPVDPWPKPPGGHTRIYVEVDLANKRYCKGCPCLRGNKCDAFGGIYGRVLHGECVPFGDPVRKWLRPQACIKASMSIGNDVDLALHVRAQDRQENKPCT